MATRKHLAAVRGQPQFGVASRTQTGQFLDHVLDSLLGRGPRHSVRVKAADQQSCVGYLAGLWQHIDQRGGRIPGYMHRRFTIVLKQKIAEAKEDRYILIPVNRRKLMRMVAKDDRCASICKALRGHTHVVQDCTSQTPMHDSNDDRRLLLRRANLVFQQLNVFFNWLT